MSLPRCFSTTIACLLLCVAASASAQDRRTVLEPRLPSHVCATLEPEAPVDDTQRLQAALNACPQGQAVQLRAGPQGRRWVTGPLRIPSGITLWIDHGTTLAASTNPADYDKGQGRCGQIDSQGSGCQPFITIQRTEDSAIVGDGEIEGQGDQPMQGRSETWWELARRAQREGGKQNIPRLIQITQSRNVLLYKIRLRNAPNFHVALDQVQGFTAWGVVIDTPADARNTDGIDPGASEDVTIAHSDIRTGDDNVAIKAQHGPSRYISILDNHFYSGHGMSIGSETTAGVSDVLVRGLTLDGTTWGLRIKSDTDRGGLVERVRYEDICLRNNRWPVSLVTQYRQGASTGNSIPQYRDITLRSVQGQGGEWVLQGVDAAHAHQVLLDGVQFDASARWTVSHTQTLAPTTTPSQPPDCSARWQPFPEALAPTRTAPSASTSHPPETGTTLHVGAGQRYSRIQDALAAAPKGATIHIAPGSYQEVLHLRTPGVRLIGDGAAAEDVVIEGSRSAGDSGGTGKSAIVFAEADGVELWHLTIANRFHDEHPEVTQDAQAVALNATGDRQRFIDLRLLSYQDTLYAARRGCSQAPCPPARQYYRDTTIRGAVDFIFGNALAYFENVSIVGVERAQVIVTAQSCEREDEICGYVFHHSRIQADPSVHQIALGRPWRALSTVAFIDTDMDGRVIPEGFIDWNQEHRLATTRYLEAGSRGAGAAPLAQREPYLMHPDADTLAHLGSANRYLAGSDGWQAETTTPP